MIPLQITATTPHGIVLSRPWGPALDGLLSSVIWHRRKWAARAAGDYLTYQHHNAPELIDLPLARCGDPDRDPDWHWMATFADLHPRTEDPPLPEIRWRTSLTDHHRLQQLSTHIGRQAVSDRSGRYQNRLVPGMAQLATHITWRAVGDPDRIRELLTELPSIGKHRGVGEGRITQWSIAELDEVSDWSAGHEHQSGILGRTTPARCLADRTDISTGPVATASLRPPYLHPVSRTPGVYQPIR